MGQLCSTLHRSTNAVGRSSLPPMTSIAASCTAEQLQEAAAGIVSSVAWSIPRKSTNLQRRSHWMPAFKLPHWTECRHRGLRNNLKLFNIKETSTYLYNDIHIFKTTTTQIPHTHHLMFKPALCNVQNVRHENLIENNQHMPHDDT